MFLQGKAIGKPFKVAPCLTSFHRNLRAFQCHFFQENFGQWFVNNLWRRALFPWGKGALGEFFSLRKTPAGWVDEQLHLCCAPLRGSRSLGKKTLDVGNGNRLALERLYIYIYVFIFSYICIWIVYDIHYGWCKFERWVGLGEIYYQNWSR